MNSVIDKNKESWHARLELGYKKTQHKTILSHRLHKGPLVVQKSFYPEKNVCHSYLIHPPGGIVGGDILELEAKLNADSHALITTPAANKFYRSNQDLAKLTNVIRIKENAILEWLPQETIFYNDCAAKIQTEFDLDDGAHLTCWEINCYGRPAGNEFFKKGVVMQKIIVRRNGIPFYIDRNVIDGESSMMNAKWGLNNFPVMATMLVTLNTKSNSASNEVKMETIKELQEHTERRIMSCTQHNDLLIIRYFGFHAREALAFFARCWSITRPQLIKKQSCPPRIWET